MGTRSQLLLVVLAVFGLAGCQPEAAPVRQEDSYFLWAGVTPPDRLVEAKRVYVLAGEVRAREPGVFVPLRPQPPSVRGSQVWLVVRTETLYWDEAVYQRIAREMALWDKSTRLVGLQVDFDAATHGLWEYGRFLRGVRARLPDRYRLSITGLMDWSANGDPRALERLAGTVDEAVIQTYQGRSTIPGYEAYLKRIERLPFDYRIGVVEDGGWKEPAYLARDPHYRGTVTFLVEP